MDLKKKIDQYLNELGTPIRTTPKGAKTFTNLKKWEEAAHKLKADVFYGTHLAEGKANAFLDGRKIGSWNGSTGWILNNGINEAESTNIEALDKSYNDMYVAAKQFMKIAKRWGLKDLDSLEEVMENMEFAVDAAIKKIGK